MQKQATEAAVEAVAAWKESADELNRRIDEMAKVQLEATAQTRKLNDLFAKHDLQALAAAKPGLVERRVNAGTAAVLRMLEWAAGAD